MFDLPPRRRALPGSAARLFELSALRAGSRSDNEAEIRGLCANAFLGGATSLCRVLGRYKLFVDTADLGHSSHLLLDGYWEMWVTEAMASVLEPGMTAVDVGANLGYFTMLMADLVGPTGFVHAFEPNPAVADRLRRSLSVNGFAARTSLHAVALSDTTGASVDLIIPPHDPMNAHMVEGTTTPPAGAVRLRTQRLDGVPGLDRVDFIKIDADTAEQAIWRGAEGLFETKRPMTVFLEFAPARYADPPGFLQEIKAQGFALNQIHFDGLRPATADSILASGAPVEDRMLALCR